MPGWSRCPGEVLAFAAPPLVRSGPVAQEDADRVLRLLRLGRDDVIDLAWTDNGPGWISVELPSAEAVLDIVPDTTAAAGLAVGVVGRYAVEEEAPDGALVEVRAFYDDGAGLFEDPVTGSLNAGIAQWLIGAGRLPQRYRAAQGSRIGRSGRIDIEARDGAVWVGGEVVTRIVGEISWRPGNGSSGAPQPYRWASMAPSIGESRPAADRGSRAETAGSARPHASSSSVSMP